METGKLLLKSKHIVVDKTVCCLKVESNTGFGYFAMHATFATYPDFTQMGTL